MTIPSSISCPCLRSSDRGLGSMALALPLPVSESWLPAVRGVPGSAHFSKFSASHFRPPSSPDDALPLAPPRNEFLAWEWRCNDFLDRLCGSSNNGVTRQFCRNPLEPGDFGIGCSGLIQDPGQLGPTRTCPHWFWLNLILGPTLAWVT